MNFILCGSKGNEENNIYKNDNNIQDVDNYIIESNNIKVIDLAYHWAPVHYQDIFQIDNDLGRHDYITRVDRQNSDGSYEWDLKRNWDKSLSYELPAYVYFSIVASNDHFYITYSFFHPWDARIGCEVDYDYSGIFPFGECVFDKLIIERGGKSGWDLCGTRRLTSINCAGGWKTNDMEGVLFVVKRNGSYGKLEVIFVQGHGYIHTYLPEGLQNSPFNKAKRLRPYVPVFTDEARESMNDNVLRIVTTQEQGGHGVGCLGYDKKNKIFEEWSTPDLGAGSVDCSLLACGNYGFTINRGGDHIRYIPSRTDAEEPDVSSIRSGENESHKNRIYSIMRKGEFRSIERFENSSEYIYCKYKLINMFGPNGLWYNRFREKVFPRFITGETGDKRSNVDFDWIGHGAPPWNWRGDKLPMEQVNKLQQDDLKLSPENKKIVSRSAHPWTHNPHSLCRVYLKNRIGNTYSYFTSTYTWNLFKDEK